MRLTKTSDAQVQFIRALVYGDSGVGKTTSLRTLWPENTTIVLSERGALPLRELDFEVIQVEEWNDIKKLYTAFADPSSIEDPALKVIVAKTKVLAFDGLSDIAALCMKHLIEVDRKSLIQQRSKNQRDSPEGIYEDTMALEDWKAFRQRMLNLVSAFCHLPLHIIMTCRAEWKIDANSRDTLRLPFVGGGKTGGELPGYFDLVFFMKTMADDQGGTSYVWQTFNDNMVPAKGLSDLLDPYEPADWADVFWKILGDKQETANGT